MTKLDKFGYYGQIPVCNTIKKILIGKVFSFGSSRTTFVILGVKRNNLYGYLEVLCGRYEYNKKYGFGNSVNVYSWYCFQPKNMCFYGRDNKQAIRNCLKKNPQYIKYHLGKQIDSSKFVLYSHSKPLITYKYGDIIIYDDRNYYADYLKNNGIIT